ncbi:hypothetical protein [Bradyrhizobium japonicum]|uniref:hypothetical protein n=1 Tax=Bradyrhizobium japonicum TaxID=375 RepID=UPI001BA778C4|nr:hypothetical protein [Bradyrhizobium japonicum]MBR0956186.1 hypothetical protein [Bradyrhizobium japonicum]
MLMVLPMVDDQHKNLRGKPLGLVSLKSNPNRAARNKVIGQRENFTGDHISCAMRSSQSRAWRDKHGAGLLWNRTSPGHHLCRTGIPQGISQYYVTDLD